MASADFTWDPVSGVDGYNVYINKDDAGYNKENTSLITETEYTAEDIENGSYKAYATSVLSSEESSPSKIVDFEVEEDVL